MEKKKRVTVFSTDQNQDAPIFVALNGRQMYVQQGQEVEMDEGLIEVLQNAVERLPGKDHMKGSIVPRFLVTIHGDAEKTVKKDDTVKPERPSDKLK